MRLETASETRYQLRLHAMQWLRNAVEKAIQGLRVDGEAPGFTEDGLEHVSREIARRVYGDREYVVTVDSSGVGKAEMVARDLRCVTVRIDSRW